MLECALGVGVGIAHAVGTGGGIVSRVTVASVDVLLTRLLASRPQSLIVLAPSESVTVTLPPTTQAVQPGSLDAGFEAAARSCVDSRQSVIESGSAIVLVRAPILA